MGRNSISEADNSVVEGEKGELSYEEKLNYVNAIASPMASKKLTKKLCKVVKKAYKVKKCTFSLKDVQRKFRKGETEGLIVIGGDFSPIDFASHLPALCEEKDVPYCYVPSRFDLGAALGSKGGRTVIMVAPDEGFKDLYDECVEEMKHLPHPF